jgi:UrcA family protein
MRNILQAQTIALMAGALLSGGALAQEAEGVTVQASRVDVTELGRTSSGVPVLSLSVTHQVSLADLDLGTTGAMAEVESRVREAAWHGCREIDMAHQSAQPSDWQCARLATEDAMARIRELVAAN